MNKRMSEEQAKELFLSILKGLKERGMNIAGGAFIKVGEDGKIENVEEYGSLKEKSEKPKTPSIEDYKALRDRLKEDLSVLFEQLKKKKAGQPFGVPQDILERYGYKVPQPKNEVEGEQMPNEPMEEVNEDENCTCPNCLNFDNFEEKLGKVKGEFDYAEVTLGKKLFKIKYHKSESGDENMVMRDSSEDVDIENSSNEELQLLLQEAVRERKFDKAQVILNAIQERKNKN